MSCARELPEGLLDEIAFAALQSVIGDLDTSQANKLLEILETTRSLNITLAFLARQVARRVWPLQAASRVAKVLQHSYVEGDVAKARYVTGLYKWLFEAGKGMRNAISDLMYKYRRTTAAPKGFFREYISALLSLG